MVKNPPANIGGTSSISGLGKCPREGNGNPLQYSCLGNPMDRGARGLHFMGSQIIGHDSVTRDTNHMILYYLFA